MGNKNKKTDEMEKAVMKKIKKNCKELVTESIMNVSEASNQNKVLVQNNKKIKHKKLNNKLVIDVPEKDTKNETQDSGNGTVVQSTKTKIKHKNNNNVEQPEVKKIKTNQIHELSVTPVKSKNKTIAFDDFGESQESLVNNNKSKRKFLNEDEAEVKEEDIDKFCDGITDEDNKTYENWVQLFEQNFKKNKES